LQSELNLDYLDDRGGPIDNVASDVAHIVHSGGNMGLLLNTSNCELIGSQGVEVKDRWLQPFTRVSRDVATILAVPLVQGPALDKAWEK